MQQHNLPSEKIDSVIALYSSGKIEETIDVIGLLTNDYPNEPLLINITGACYASIREFEKAVRSYKKAIKIKPDYVDAIYNLGNTYRELDQLDNSIKSYKKVININPEHQESQHNLGVSLYELGFLFEAIEHFEKALIINPNNTKIQINLGNILVELDLPYEAIEQYERVLAKEPKNSIAHNNLGNVLRDIGQTEEATEHYINALKINKNYSEAYYNLGYIYQYLGQLEQAIIQYENAIAINDLPTAYQSLSHLKNYKSNNPHITKMKSLLKSGNLSQLESIHIHLALANIYEKLEMQVDFFRYLNEGNRLQKIQSNYSLSSTSREHSSIKELFRPTLTSIEESNKFYNSEKRPIFIVGMPCSGTSLVEQIIASHNNVHSAGELNTLTKLASPIINNFTAGDINELTEKSIFFIRSEYIDMLGLIDTTHEFITDKLPLNFQYIGFILSAFPEAKIVHLKRDARAICWSNYKHYFESKNNGYSNNFKDLAGFYGLYKILMSFWYEKYPNKIYDIDYEDLILNPEEETRKLLKYCELDWDENCLNFQTNERTDKKVSSLQARQKIYQGSSETWKKHWSFIQPLIEALKPY